jgi:hypothetical protein
VLFLAVVACGGRTSTPAHPDLGSGAPHDAPAGTTAEAPPNDADCDALIAHAVALAAAERPEHTVNDDDQAHARGDLHAQYAAKCRAMSRSDYLCALSAPSLESFAGCADHDHATRSSSTSNSSVAPGGMTPAAPRSP